MIPNRNTVLESEQAGRWLKRSLQEALRRWSNAPISTKRLMLSFDTSKRLWPPGATSASKAASERAARESKLLCARAFPRTRPRDR